MRILTMGADGEIFLPKEVLEEVIDGSLVDISICENEIVIRPLGKNVVPFKAVGE